MTQTTTPTANDLLIKFDLVEDEAGRRVYIEVKNTTLRVESAEGPIVSFPDAVTARGLKHLRELQAMVAEGHRGAAVFFVHRDDVQAFKPAREIDPAYANELDRASSAGVEILPIQARIDDEKGNDNGSTLRWSLPGLLPRA